MDKCFKLKEDFFDDFAIQELENQPDGEFYVNIYLKLALMSFKNDGYLVRKIAGKEIPHDEKSIAKKLWIDVDRIKMCLLALTEHGLINVCDEPFKNTLKVNIF